MNDKEPVKYKNAFERNEEVRKERLNREWNDLCMDSTNVSKKIFDSKIISEGMIKSLKGNWVKCERNVLW